MTTLAEQLIDQYLGEATVDGIDVPDELLKAAESTNFKLNSYWTGEKRKQWRGQVKGWYFSHARLRGIKKDRAEHFISEAKRLGYSANFVPKGSLVYVFTPLR